MQADCSNLFTTNGDMVNILFDFFSLGGNLFEFTSSKYQAEAL